MSHHILQLVERFLRETAMPPSVFGREAVRDPRLVSDLRSGREPGSKLCQRVLTYMTRWRELRADGAVAAVGDRRTSEGRAATRSALPVRSQAAPRHLCQQQGDWA